MDGGPLALDSPAGRWLLVTAVLGSAVTTLEATVVNVALPAIGADLGAGHHFNCGVAGPPARPTSLSGSR